MLPRRRVHLVAPPLRPGPWERVQPVEATGPTVLCIGRLERLKAPETVVSAAARLRSIPGLKVVFVGVPYAAASGEPYDIYLRRLAAEGGVVCEIVPPTADTDGLCDLISQARVVVVPSRFETLSMVGLEAMAAGRPVILSSRVGLAELTTDRLSVPVADPDDVATWATHLHRFLTDARAAASAGASNRAFVHALTREHRIVDSRLEVYRAVIDGTTATTRPARARAARAEVSS
jgi:glycosyltransferase involved in cell wall biosynthesis